MTLALLVTGVTYRHPGLLAKIVTTLDILSEGRAQLGLGAAWYEREHNGLGVPFPPIGERFERLEETLQICHQMWSDDDGPVSKDVTTSWPRPSARPGRSNSPDPGPRGWERGAERPFASWPATPTRAICSPPSPRSWPTSWRCWRDTARTEGRDPDSIQKTILGMQDPLADEDAFLAGMEEYAQARRRPGRGDAPRSRSGGLGGPAGRAGCPGP